MEREEIGWYTDVKEEIKKHINKKIERLWQEGISGADYFISAIGSAIEIFGKYEKVMDYEGNVIRADKLLDFVRIIVREYAAKQKGIAGLSPLTNYYFFWRWTYGEAKIHFDDARKLALSSGINLESKWNRGFIIKAKEFIGVLGPQERNMEELEESTELIDVLHKVLNLWKAGKREEMKKVLAETGWGNKDVFYRVAQAISETFPKDSKSKEKLWLDGFLSGKEKIMHETKDKIVQRRLFP